MIFVIGGTMRSGKTILSKRIISDFGFSHIPTDHLVIALRKACPNSGVGSHGLTYDELCDRFKPVLIALLASLASEEGSSYVVDGYYIRPNDIVEKERSLKAYFLGYPNMTPRDKVLQIRRYGKTRSCYTNQMTDSTLFRNVEKWIEESKKLVQTCNEYEKEFFNVSHDFEECLASGLVRVKNYITKYQGVL
jgi:hypothetical protein